MVIPIYNSINSIWLSILRHHHKSWYFSLFDFKFSLIQNFFQRHVFLLFFFSLDYKWDWLFIPQNYQSCVNQHFNILRIVFPGWQSPTSQGLLYRWWIRFWPIFTRPWKDIIKTFLLKEEYGHIWYWTSACNNFLHHLSPLSWDSLTLLKVTASSMVSPMWVGRVRSTSKLKTVKEVKEVREEIRKDMGKEEGKQWAKKERNKLLKIQPCLPPVSISPALLMEGLPFYVIPS